MTTRGVHAHELRWEGLELVDLPLRAWVQLGYFASRSRTFCGTGNEVDCDPAVAEVAARGQGHEPSSQAYEQAVDRYYLFPMTMPYGVLNLRWRLREGPRKVELFGGWRGNLYSSGLPGEPGPYPGSLYAAEFPQGEAGLASVFQLGALLDARDQEPSATRGFFVEASLRASSPVWGSAWDFVGFHNSWQLFLSLDPGQRVVLADRFVVDLLAGDVHSHELAQVGGTAYYFVYGGYMFGRGIRESRYLGRIKLMDQLELRWMPLELTLLRQRVDVGTVTFVDLGCIGLDWGDWGGDPARLLPATGAGLRLALNEDFVVRADLGVSPVEDWTPALYLLVGQTF